MLEWSIFVAHDVIIDRVNKLPGGRRLRRFGSEDRFWSLGRFLWPIVGMGVFWSKAQLTFGIFGFLSKQQYQVGICVASWHLLWMERIFLLPKKWWNKHPTLLDQKTSQKTHLGCQLFSWSFSSGWFTGGLLGTSHFSELYQFSWFIEF